MCESGRAVDLLLHSREMNQSAEPKVSLTCECGKDFERPQKYVVWNSQHPSVFWRWMLKYCDTCYKKRTQQALQSLPEIISKFPT